MRRSCNEKSNTVTAASFVLVGYGGVGRTVLEVILGRGLLSPSTRIVVIDLDEEAIAPANRGRLAAAAVRNDDFIHSRVMGDNFSAVLGRLLKAGDILVDCASRVDTIETMRWCYERGVHFANTAVEWPDHQDESIDQTTLYHYVETRALGAELRRTRPPAGTSPLLLTDCGMNPGLVSHFAFLALRDMAEEVARKAEAEGDADEAARLRALARERRHAELARALEVDAVLSVERDHQVPREGYAPRAGAFVSTWSPEAAIDEIGALSEVNFADGMRQGGLAFETMAPSWTPAGPYEGFVVQHGECYSLPDSLQSGPHRPASAFVYRPSDVVAQATLDVLIACRGDVASVPEEALELVTDGMEAGEDQVGAMVVSRRHGAWWAGSCLDCREARRLVPGVSTNATEVQVAAGLYAAIAQVVRPAARPAAASPVLFPEDLDTDAVLAAARPYLGRLVSCPVPGGPAAAARFWREPFDALRARAAPYAPLAPAPAAACRAELLPGARPAPTAQV